MSDDVRQAAFIGSAINKGLGDIPTFNKKRKKSDKDTDKKTAETTKTAETPTPSSSSSDTKALPKTKNPSSKKAKAPSAPVFVKSERVNNSTITPTKEITTGQKQLPVGRQFTEYSGIYGTDKQPPVNLTNL